MIDYAVWIVSCAAFIVTGTTIDRMASMWRTATPSHHNQQRNIRLSRQAAALRAVAAALIAVGAVGLPATPWVL